MLSAGDEMRIYHFQELCQSIIAGETADKHHIQLCDLLHTLKLVRTSTPPTPPPPPPPRGADLPSCRGTTSELMLQLTKAGGPDR